MSKSGGQTLRSGQTLGGHTTNGGKVLDRVKHQLKNVFGIVQVSRGFFLNEHVIEGSFLHAGSEELELVGENAFALVNCAIFVGVDESIRIGIELEAETGISGSLGVLVQGIVEDGFYAFDFVKNGFNSSIAVIIDFGHTDFAVICKAGDV